MTSNVSVDISELNRLSRQLRDTSILRNATEISLNNASNVVIVEAKQHHIFTSRSFTLEDSIFKEVDRNTLKLYVPTTGTLGVPYANWIWYGSRPTTNGTATWNNGDGDPFIQTAFERKRNAFISEFRNTMLDELERHIG